MTILGADFKGLFASAMGSLLHDVSISHVTPGTVDPTDPSAGNRPTTTTVTGKGTSTKVVSSYVDKDTGARKTEFEAIVLLGTLSSQVPIAISDMVTTVDPRPPGTGTITGVVVEVKVDPDGASAILRCLS